MIKRQAGVSLLELLLVISIMASILLLTTRYFALSRLQTKVAQSVSQIQTLSDASYRWLGAQKQLLFDGSGTPGGVAVSLVELQNAQLVNPGINDTQDAWGGSITVRADSEDAHYIQIILPNAPVKACNSLKQRLASSAHTQIADCTSSSGYYASF